MQCAKFRETHPGIWQGASQIADACRSGLHERDLAPGKTGSAALALRVIPWRRSRVDWCLFAFAHGAHRVCGVAAHPEFSGGYEDHAWGRGFVFLRAEPGLLQFGPGRHGKKAQTGQHAGAGHPEQKPPVQRSAQDSAGTTGTVTGIIHSSR